MNSDNRYPIRTWGKPTAGMLGLLGIVASTVFLSPNQSEATAAWSNKYKVNCRTCHTPTFARLNLDGERYLLNGYQSPDDEQPDGNKAGKRAFGDNLSLEKEVGNWLMARLSVNPITVTTNGQVVDKTDTLTKVALGGTPWLQLFVAGSIAKNISIYIENEITPDAVHIAWYYMGFHNLFGTTLANLQIGRLTPVLFQPFPDRLPQLPGLVGKPGVMRVKSSNGKGGASVDLRSPRHGAQFYGYKDAFVYHGGVSTGGKDSYPGELGGLNYWGGLKLLLPESKGNGALSKFEGSSIGYLYYAGTDIKGTNTATENNFQRHMPGLNLRWNDKLDIQASYVIGIDDNFNLDSVNTAKKELNYQGVRALGNYHVNDFWSVGGQYDHYWSDNSSRLAEEWWAYFPVLTYMPRENIRLSLYPGFDLRDVADNLKKHEILTNIRIGF